MKHPKRKDENRLSDVVNRGGHSVTTRHSKLLESTGHPPMTSTPCENHLVSSEVSEHQETVNGEESSEEMLTVVDGSGITMFQPYED